LVADDEQAALASACWPRNAHFAAAARYSRKSPEPGLIITCPGAVALLVAGCAPGSAPLSTLGHRHFLLLKRINSFRVILKNK
jgi:hypothetical protein